jgi:hypothetical protein
MKVTVSVTVSPMHADDIATLAVLLDGDSGQLDEVDMGRCFQYWCERLSESLDISWSRDRIRTGIDYLLQSLDEFDTELP